MEDSYGTFWDLFGIACVVFSFLAGLSLLLFTFYRYGRETDVEIQTDDPELVQKLVEKGR